MIWNISMDQSPDDLNNSADGKTLIFLHLLKTGGRTLASVLKRNYSDDVRFHYGQRPGETLEDLQQLSEPERRSLQLVHGHFDFGIHTCFPQPCTYITLLRHPVERVISHYYYALHNPQHYTHQLVKENDMSLTDYLEHGIIDLNNGQTRRIAGNISHRFKINESSEELLEIAKSHIQNHFLMVGVTERFDEFLLLLKRQLGLTSFLYTNSNVNPFRPRENEFSSDVIELIKHYNQLDLQLYTFVWQQFQNSIDRLADSSFQTELNLLRQFNAQYSDVQAELTKVKTKFSTFRATFKRVKRDRNRISADLDMHHETLHVLLNSRGGRLWQQWIRLKQRIMNE